jgi:hypothetical protein
LEQLGDLGLPSAHAFLEAMIDPQKRPNEVTGRQEPTKWAGQAR